MYLFHFSASICENMQNCCLCFFQWNLKDKQLPRASVEVTLFHWPISLLLSLRLINDQNYTWRDFASGPGCCCMLASFHWPMTPTNSHLTVKRSRKRRNGEVLSKDAVELWGPRRGGRGWEAWSERRRPPSPPSRAFLSRVTSWQMLHQLMRAQCWCEEGTFDNDDDDDDKWLTGWWWRWLWW